MVRLHRLAETDPVEPVRIHTPIQKAIRKKPILTQHEKLNKFVQFVQHLSAGELREHERDGSSPIHADVPDWDQLIDPLSSQGKNVIRTIDAIHRRVPEKQRDWRIGKMVARDVDILTSMASQTPIQFRKISQLHQSATHPTETRASGRYSPDTRSVSRFFEPTPAPYDDERAVSESGRSPEVMSPVGSIASRLSERDQDFLQFGDDEDLSDALLYEDEESELMNRTEYGAEGVIERSTEDGAVQQHAAEEEAVDDENGEGGLVDREEEAIDDENGEVVLIDRAEAATDRAEAATDRAEAATDREEAAADREEEAADR